MIGFTPRRAFTRRSQVRTHRRSSPGSRSAKGVSKSRAGRGSRAGVVLGVQAVAPAAARLDGAIVAGAATRLHEREPDAVGLDPRPVDPVVEPGDVESLEAGGPGRRGDRQREQRRREPRAEQRPTCR